MFRIKLKELREKENLSQATLAKSMEVSQGTVGNWESGIREPNLTTLIKLSDYFNVSIDYLLGRSNTNSPILSVPPVPFRKRLKELRERENISQAMLAKTLNISQGTVGSWETGIHEPNFATLAKLSDYFDISIDYLLGRTDIKEQETVAESNPASPSGALQEIEKILNDADIPQSEKDDLFQRFTQIYFLSKGKNEKP